MDTDTSAALQHAAGSSRLAQIFVEAMFPSGPEKLRRLAEDMARKEGADTLDLLQQAAEKEKSRLQSIKANGPRRRRIKGTEICFDPVVVLHLEWLVAGLGYNLTRTQIIRYVMETHAGKPKGREGAKLRTKSEAALKNAINWGRMSIRRKEAAHAFGNRIKEMDRAELAQELRATLASIQLSGASSEATLAH